MSTSFFKLSVYLQSIEYRAFTLKELKLMVFRDWTEDEIETFLQSLFQKTYIGLTKSKGEAGEEMFTLVQQWWPYSSNKASVSRKVKNTVSIEMALKLIREAEEEEYSRMPESLQQLNNEILSLYTRSEWVQELKKRRDLFVKDYFDNSDPAKFYNPDSPKDLAEKIREATFWPGACSIPISYNDAFVEDAPNTEDWIKSAIKERFRLKMIIDCFNQKIQDLSSPSVEVPSTNTSRITSAERKSLEKFVLKFKVETYWQIEQRIKAAGYFSDTGKWEKNAKLLAELLALFYQKGYFSDKSRLSDLREHFEERYGFEIRREYVKPWFQKKYILPKFQRNQSEFTHFFE